MLLVLIFCFFLVIVAASEKDYPSIGFGLHQLKQFHAKGGKLFLNKEEASKCDDVQEYYFNKAIIDNFAPIQDQKYWEGTGQRYWLNKQFWGGIGFPIFVFIGGEGEESCSRLTNRMYAYNLAQSNQGLLVNLEHRFYGESYPTIDMSTSNLKYLSADQALADLARFIGYLKADLNSDVSKVITIGGSYPGNLAAWFRLKYPSVTTGSIASSAPVTAKTNFYSYMDVVAQSIIHFSGQSCYNAFEIAANKVSELIKSRSGVQQLEVDFQTCRNLTSAKDIAILLSDLMGNVQGTIQYNNEHSGVMNVTNICATMLQSNDPYTNFIALQSQYRQANGQVCENANWEATIEYLSNPIKDPTNNARPWTYQTCNEFGYFQTTDSNNQPFYSWKLLDLNFYMDMCAEAFAPWTHEPQINWVNQEYGDVHIAGTDILFPSGTIDPWHVLGVTNYTVAFPKSSNTELPVFIEDTAHCADLYAPANSDPPSLTYAREIIANNVNGLLNQ